MFKNYFLSEELCQVTHLQDLKNFVGQYWSHNSERDKIFNKIENNRKL